jgi:hypothetical protein
LTIANNSAEKVNFRNLYEERIHARAGIANIELPTIEVIPSASTEMITTELPVLEVAPIESMEITVEEGQSHQSFSNIKACYSTGFETKTI